MGVDVGVCVCVCRCVCERVYRCVNVIPGELISTFPQINSWYIKRPSPPPLGSVTPTDPTARLNQQKHPKIYKGSTSIAATAEREDDGREALSTSIFTDDAIPNLGLHNGCIYHGPLKQNVDTL